MATTVAAIREVMVSTVKALTPTSHAQRKFKPHRQDVDFRTWCEQNPAAAFRVFSIREDMTEHQGPFVTNTDLEELRTVLECQVAYPLEAEYINDAGMRRPLLDRDDVLSEDRKKIRRAIGLNGYQTLDAAGGNATVFEEQVTVEPLDACVYLVLRLGTMYREAS